MRKYPSTFVLCQALLAAPADQFVIRLAARNRSPRVAETLLSRCSIKLALKKRMLHRVTKFDPQSAIAWLEESGGPAMFSYKPREYAELLGNPDPALRDMLIMSAGGATIMP